MNFWPDCLALRAAVGARGRLIALALFRSAPLAAWRSEPALPAARSPSFSRTALRRTPAVPPLLVLPPSCAPQSSQNSCPHRRARPLRSKGRVGLPHLQFPHSRLPQNLLREPTLEFPLQLIFPGLVPTPQTRLLSKRSASRRRPGSHRNLSRWCVRPGAPGPSLRAVIAQSAAGSHVCAR